MSISELTPFQISIIMNHFLNDCEIRFWLVPDKQFDNPPSYIEIEQYYTANNTLIALGIIEVVNNHPDAKPAIEAVYRDGRQAYATRITEMGKIMFSAEQMTKRLLN